MVIQTCSLPISFSHLNVKAKQFGVHALARDQGDVQVTLSCLSPNCLCCSFTLHFLSTAVFMQTRQDTSKTRDEAKTDFSPFNAKWRLHFPFTPCFLVDCRFLCKLSRLVIADALATAPATPTHYFPQGHPSSAVPDAWSRMGEPAGVLLWQCTHALPTCGHFSLSPPPPQLQSPPTSCS